MIKVTKEITFDCAHVLSGYNGACANLHGHTYKLQVTVEGESKKDGVKDGMVIDFNNLKTLLDSDVKAAYDHAVIISCEKKRDLFENSLYELLLAHEKRVLVLDDRTTAENMAMDIKKRILKALSEFGFNNVNDVHVRLWETPTSFAEV